MFFLRKSIRLVISLVFIISLNFVIPRMMPGNPLFTILGPDVVGLSKKDYQELETEYGLNEPQTKQYLSYWSDLITGELGFSYYHNQPVTYLIKNYLGRTLLLLFPTVILSSLLAIGFGLLAGRFSGSAIDLGISVGFLTLYAMPIFLLGMILLDLLSFRLNLFPLGGLKPVECGGGLLSCPLDVLHHLALPILILSFSSAAYKYTVVRNNAIEEEQKNYVLYARARGLNNRSIWLIHILKNASLPVLNLIALHLAFMVSGVLLIEIVFSINGMGILIYEAAVNRDYPVLQGCFLVLTILVLTFNTLVDVLSGILDPRVKT